HLVRARPHLAALAEERLEVGGELAAAAGDQDPVVHAHAHTTAGASSSFCADGRVRGRETVAGAQSRSARARRRVPRARWCRPWIELSVRPICVAISVGESPTTCRIRTTVRWSSGSSPSASRSERPYSDAVWSLRALDGRGSSVGVGRRARRWSTATLRATRRIQAENGTSRCSYRGRTVMSFVKTCWVMSSASCSSRTMLVTYP